MFYLVHVVSTTEEEPPRALFRLDENVRERERGEGEREKTEREWMAHGPLAETRQHGLPAPEEIDLSAIPQLAGPHSFLTKHVRFMGQIETDENTYDRSGAVYRYVGIWKFDLTR